MAVLHPGRTLLEKLVLIHALARQPAVDPSTPIPARNGRHFFDVYQLLGDDRVRDLLEDHEQVHDVMASVEEITRRVFRGRQRRDATRRGLRHLPGLRPPLPGLRVYPRAAFDRLPELYFGAGPLPTWESICTRVAEAHTLL